MTCPCEVPRNKTPPVRHLLIKHSSILSSICECGFLINILLRYSSLHHHHHIHWVWVNCFLFKCSCWAEKKGVWWWGRKMRTGARKTRIPKTSALLRPQKIISNMRFGCFVFLTSLACSAAIEESSLTRKREIKLEIQRYREQYTIHSVNPWDLFSFFFLSLCYFFFLFRRTRYELHSSFFAVRILCVWRCGLCADKFCFSLKWWQDKKKNLGGACWWENFKRTFRSARLQRRLREFPGGPGCWTDCYCCCGNGCRRRQLWRVGRAK